jgi:hypothetical protein
MRTEEEVLGTIISTIRPPPPAFKDFNVPRMLLGVIVSRLIYFTTTKEAIHPKYPVADPKLRPWFDHRTQTRAAVRDYVMTTTSSLMVGALYYDIHGKSKVIEGKTTIRSEDVNI